ncbi:LysR family transcriptional regulator [Microbacterium kyungheense]|uniref:Regulatory helix-turn-helix LysR family protein n=1 Tax=Microbacterium kyungheense TaxID=1263636 RepID=A0A543F267_9MICO|nr:LysR family transcriptional regulator [Microbacterium kyungheense]TQM27922.1 regulatory helix-turn-helix LysR family protein [Microbacterium kyungheense]
MKPTQLEQFVAVVDNGLHVPRAAEALGMPMAALSSTIEKLEAEVGHPLFTRSKSGWSLTAPGTLLLAEARQRIADAPAPVAKPAVPAGGKAKASKGKGRAPVVKGQPRPFKKRQGR